MGGSSFSERPSHCGPGGMCLSLPWARDRGHIPSTCVRCFNLMELSLKHVF
jgi:hypothetical protein